MKKLISFSLMLILGVGACMGAGTPEVIVSAATNRTGSLHFKSAIYQDTNSLSVTFPAGISSPTNINLGFVTNFNGSTSVIPSLCVVGTSNSVGSADANKTVRLGPDGKISTNSLPASSFTPLTTSATTTYLPASVAATTAFTTVLTVTNAQTTGYALISSQLQFTELPASASPQTVVAQMLEVSFPSKATTNIIAGMGIEAPGSFLLTTFGGAPLRRTATATNIYVLQGACSAAGANTKFENSFTSIVGTFLVTNATWITIQQFP